MKDGHSNRNSTPPESGQVTWRLTAAGTGFAQPVELVRERPDVAPVRTTVRVCGVSAVEGASVQPLG